MTPSTPPPFNAVSPEVQAAVQAARDTDHLRILEFVYYIAGAMTALFSCILLIHFTMFLVFGLNPQMFAHSAHGQVNQPPPAAFFLCAAAIVGCIILLGWTFGAFQIYAGRCIRNRRQLLLVMIVAGLECVFVPWGTTLGVFTFLVLNRPTVRALFGQARA